MRLNVYMLAILTLYIVMEWRGIDLAPSATRATVAQSVRNSPGGYRNYQSYHGYHGGK
jgi:hypothetical protein